MLGSSQGEAYTITVYTQVQEMLLLVSLAPSLLWATIQSDFTDFYCDCNQFDIRKFPVNSRNMRKFSYNGMLAK